MVSDIVRQKILANKFVDMSTLTDKETDGNMTMVINTNDDKPSFQLVRKSGPPKTLSIDEWTNHFNIFIAMFCSIDANKEVFLQLLIYMSMVRHLAAKHADWRYYDKTFRMLMANPACHLRWDECQMELWQEAMSRRANLSQNTNVCHRYARGEYCSGCKFLHKCGVCGAKHASSNCPVLGYQGNQGSSTHGKFRLPHFRFRGPRFGQRFNNPSNYRFPYRGMPAGINGASDNKVISSVDPLFLARALQGYDQGKASYLVNGFTEGFQFHFQGEPSHEFCNNLVSAKDMPEIVDEKLAKEIQAGRIAGPFSNPPFSTFQLSPLGVVLKKESNKFRLIHHLSFPEGSSINDGIHEEFTSVQYQTIQDAISFLKRTPTPFMAKSDIESAFRIIPIHPSQHHLLGFHWKCQFYFDKCLHMGLAESCRIFEMFSSAIELIMYQRGRTSAIVKVLDDFLFIEPSYEKCLSSLRDFQLLCSQLGVPLATEKKLLGRIKSSPF
ncbi:uncharacterized protein [Argopecten irradians]|uniref:uncharacterized protein n=1 Tax=Argopecten irradians TaxID=31199 RepID=UPI00371D57FE